MITCDVSVIAGCHKLFLMIIWMELSPIANNLNGDSPNAGFQTSLSPPDFQAAGQGISQQVDPGRHQEHPHNLTIEKGSFL